MNHEFTIDQVSWHTKTPGNTESRKHILQRFWVVTQFLQENGLTKRTLAASEGDIDDDFLLSSADLNPVGLELMKKVYDTWLTKVDEGLPCTDLSMFKKQLKKILDA